jgi:small subunit ribosomal protein S16
MPVKIRLQRHGKKGKPFYHIVAADARAPRNGKFIEKLGTYNPNTNPATIALDLDGAIQWLKDGAQPTDTARAILSYEGALHKYHLLKGVNKGAHTEEQALAKFEAWKAEKTTKIEANKNGLAGTADAEAKKRFDAEIAARKKMEEKIAAKTAEEVVEEAPAAEEAATEEAPAAEEPKTEE